jgi:hypothetical protein
LQNLPAGKLHDYIGVRDVRHVRGNGTLAITEHTLA